VAEFVFELLKAIVALFIIVDPLGNVPIFIGLTENVSREQRKKTFQTAVVVALVLLLVFALLGNSY
jgi:multiple antibiotic resistance protein